MYGTVLDQRVFEHLVERCLPSIHEHFLETDIQLSVASLPWFLSCFIASLPMVFAFRLAILKINGEELLATTDDGAFINTMKAYFASLGDSAHPRAHDSRTRQITKFQELLVVAFREFNIITDETIASERKRFRREVVVSIETFAKRTALRNLKRVGRLDKDRLGLVYDHYQLAVLRGREEGIKKARSRSASLVGGKVGGNVGMGGKEGEKVEVRLDRKAFGTLVAEIATWARNERVVKNGFHEHTVREPVDHELIDRIFLAWDQSVAGALSFQDVVDGLDSVLFNDLMSNLAWLFSIHDKNQDGYLTKDEVLQLSESLLPGDRYLGSVSNLMQNLFEYAESTKPDLPSSIPDPPPEPQSPQSVSATAHSRTPSIVSSNPHRPYLGLSTFRMCVLADELLEDFFASDLTRSWKLEVLIEEEKPKVAGAVGGAVGW
ncbi:hypothetical protein P7C70_g8982, partial [Phenoliferia sp. Uapishka_3]